MGDAFETQVGRVHDTTSTSADAVLERDKVIVGEHAVGDVGVEIVACEAVRIFKRVCCGEKI